MVGKSTFVQVEFVSNEDVRLPLSTLTKVEAKINDTLHRGIEGVGSVMYRVVFSNSKYATSLFTGKNLSTFVIAEFNGVLNNKQLEAIERATNGLLKDVIGYGGVSALFSAVQWKAGAYF